jgi:hypothetical protein
MPRTELRLSAAEESELKAAFQGAEFPKNLDLCLGIQCLLLVHRRRMSGGRAKNISLTRPSDPVCAEARRGGIRLVKDQEDHDAQSLFQAICGPQVRFGRKIQAVAGKPGLTEDYRPPICVSADINAENYIFSSPAFTRQSEIPKPTQSRILTLLEEENPLHTIREGKGRRPEPKRIYAANRMI